MTQAAGQVAGAAQFTAANAEYLSLADNAALSAGDVDFTISAWAYLDDKSVEHALVTQEGGIIFDKSSYYLHYSVADDRFLLSAWDTAQVPHNLSANSLGPPSIVTWYFLLAWHDVTADTLSLQVNNGPVDSITHAGGLKDSTAAFQIGARENPGARNFMNGRIDEVGFWKRTLTAEEWRTLYEDPGGIFRDISTEPVIPEPSCFLLLGVGLLAAAGRRGLRLAAGVSPHSEDQ